MLVLRNPETKETLAQTAQAREWSEQSFPGVGHVSLSWLNDGLNSGLIVMPPIAHMMLQAASLCTCKRNHCTIKLYKTHVFDSTSFE